MMKKTWTILTLIPLFFTFRAISSELNTGPWRFELKSDQAVIPFIVELNWNKKRLQGKLYNGKETIELRDIIYSQKKLTIPLQTYEVTLELTIEDPSLLSGFLIRHNKNPKVRTPVVARYGVKERFPGNKSAPEIDLNGRWSVSLTNEEDEVSEGVAVFVQKGNHLSATILTPTGDYRYLEGFVSGEKFLAAGFDGVFNYLLQGEIKKGKLVAALLSNSKTKIEGKQNPKADLPDAFQQTQVSALDFKFPDIMEKAVSLTDKMYLNKPVIVQIFGSWCPNCMDEMNFLIPWYEANAKRGVEVIALAFERSLSPADAKRQLSKLQKKKKIPYAVLQAGFTSEDKPMDKLPGIKNFISFPTTIFLNKKHEVVKVHAGFTGPSTGEFYEKWVQEFNTTVNELLK